MEVASQLIFTFELVVKFLAEMPEWKRYFDDGWNCLDAFVVFTGFVEMTPARIIFEAFPVVVLRLLRLLRVFRLAKALPRLRSIVEALMEGFSAVGWICVLIVVFNYIIACMYVGGSCVCARCLPLFFKYWLWSGWVSCLVLAAFPSFSFPCFSPGACFSSKATTRFTLAPYREPWYTHSNCIARARYFSFVVFF